MGCGASATVYPAENVPRGHEASKSNDHDGIHGEEEKFDDKYYADVPLKKEIDKWISDLNNTSDYADHQTLRILEEMVEQINPKDKEATIKKSNYLIKLNYAQLFLKMWHNLKNYHLVLDASKPSGKDPTEICAASSFDYAKVVLWHAAECSPRMCREIGKYGIIEILLSQLEQPEYASNKLTGTENSTPINADKAMRSNLAILLSAIRNCSDNGHRFREANAEEILSKYLDCQNAAIQAQSVLILVYSLQEVDSDPKGDESIKVKLVNKGVLPLLVNTLASKRSTEEHCLAATAIWTLASHNDNKDRIRKEEGCVEALKNRQGSENTDLRTACTNALRELREG
ncbi:uncharacterized protein LOC102809483 [Saccoglossus kowalevskii]|uniref:Uncharacterized protein LOC102809483 n=1 Tax=Saccoglossus kowalevskii TaxID=10224 RepID=A0ABM0MAD0_SACKO|nr:PREDICTED: uncharacterized protein LOC102809483 [Saccoglossus kowalevskii]